MYFLYNITFTLFNSYPASGEFWRPLMTFANNLDPDEAPQNVGLHQRSKLFDIQIIYQQKKWMEIMNFLKILKETIFEKITQHAKS